MSLIRTDTNSVAPSTPATGKTIIYSKSDGKYYSKDDGGNEYLLSGGGGSLGPAVIMLPLDGEQGEMGMPIPGAPGVNTGISGAATLLHENSGTDSSAGATDVDTFAITGLTAKDILLFIINAQSATQPTAGLQIYNSTDNVRIMAAYANPINANTPNSYFGITNQMQVGATSVSSMGVGPDGVRADFATFTTNYTGNWTVALRHGGVTAGGTLQWKWAIYKIAGQ